MLFPKSVLQYGIDNMGQSSYWKTAPLTANFNCAGSAQNLTGYWGPQEGIEELCWEKTSDYFSDSNGAIQYSSK